MNAPPPMFYVWNGMALEPMDRFSRLAEQSFTSGHAYKMIVQEEEDRRTQEQNRKMWAMLGEISAQLELREQRSTRTNGKRSCSMRGGKRSNSCRRSTARPSIPYGNQSSKMSKADMTSFIEFIMAEGTQRGVKFADDVADHAR